MLRGCFGFTEEAGLEDIINAWQVSDHMTDVPSLTPYSLAGRTPHFTPKGITSSLLDTGYLLT